MRSLSLLIVCAAALGGFLTFVGFGIAGGGHGPALPLVVFFGLATLLMLGEQLWIGGIVYAIYATAYWALRQKTRFAGAIVLLIHYASVGALLILWRAWIFDRLGADFANVWRVMPGWLIASALAFAAANMAMLAPSIRAWRPAPKQVA